MGKNKNINNIDLMSIIFIVLCKKYMNAFSQIAQVFLIVYNNKQNYSN